jgi:carboxymethylenebutenolidase
VTVGLRRNMEATLFVPKGAGPFPTILEMHTSGGISESDRSYCASLAREGYICIAPAFLRAYGITSETRRKSFTSDAHAIYDDFVNIIRYQQDLPQAKRGATGAVGFSNGGFFAALLAATSAVRAAVSYYGAFNGAGTDVMLSNMQSRWRANSAPILILAGENDATIGTKAPRILESIIRGAGGRYELKMYPDTGHDFDRSGVTGPGNAAATADAWRRTLTFLRANGV